MPVNWTISHADRLIVVVAEGTVTLQEIEQYLDWLDSVRGTNKSPSKSSGRKQPPAEGSK